MRLKIHEGQKINENQKTLFKKFLWHGTKDTDYNEIIKSKIRAINKNFSNNCCMWGPGTYFAVNASYSQNYRFH